MIKGKYAAQIEIDISVDENTPNLLPFDELKNAVKKEMHDVILTKLDDEFSAIGTTMIKTYGTCRWWDDNGVCNNDAAGIFQSGVNGSCPFWENDDEKMWDDEE